MNRQFLFFAYAFMLTACISIHGDFDSSDGNYSCRSDSSKNIDNEGKLTCYVCDKKIQPGEPESDKYQKAIVWCQYISNIQKDSNGKNRETWFKLDMPKNIIKSVGTKNINDPKTLGEDPVGVDNIKFIKSAHIFGLDSWFITLHRKKDDPFGNIYFYSYIIIKKAYKNNRSLDSSLFLDFSKYIKTISCSRTNPFEPGEKGNLYDQKPNQQLLEAVNASDMDRLNTISVTYPNLDPNLPKNKNGGNALATAAWNANNDIVKFLLDFPKINIYYTDTAGNTALSNAIAQNYPVVVQTLKDRYAQNLISACKRLMEQTPETDNYKATITEINTIFNQCNIIDVTAQDIDNKTALDYLPQSQYSITSDIQTIKNKFIPHTLFHAVTSNNSTAIDTIFTQYPNLDPNVPLNDDQNNVLTLAALNGNSDIITQLLKFSKINIYFTGQYKYTALSIAIDQKNSEIIQTLKARYASNLLNACKRLTNETQNTNNYNADIAEINTIFTQCSDVNITDTYTYAQQLPNSNIKTNIVNFLTVQLQQQLLNAASNKDLNTVTTFLTQYPTLDPNIAKDMATKDTALTTAAGNGGNDIITALLKFPKINIYYSNNSGETALKIAADQKKSEIVQTLKARYASNLLDACKRLAEQIPGTTGYDVTKVNAAIDEINTVFTQCSDVDVTAKDSTGHNAFYYVQQLPTSNQHKQAIVNLFASRGAQAV